MIKLSVIIINYNVKYFLEQCVQSVLKACTQTASSEIIIVDNHSADGSVEFIKNRFPQIHIISNTSNVGFSAANNQAIKIATGEYILLLNPDTIVEEDTFKKCIAFLDTHPNAGALGVKMIDGKGKFLPESKRAFPSPEVAFYKAFGLSAIFPKSKLFGKYHLGYLSENETHEADVLAGAFMMISKKVLDEIGLLDETFFMYGEDIDISYRIKKAGYKNYYFPQTTIIHYKGESTKKGSLNYVRMFYLAMKIFAKKHFSGTYAGLFSSLINIAIYVRATAAVAGRVLKKIALPVADAVLIFAGMYLIKEYWEYYVRYIQGGKYPAEYLFINVPLYIFIWILTLYLSGAYDKHANTIKIIRGVFWGTLLISALYGFLPETLRFSRGMIIAGAAYTVFIVVASRFILHFIKFKNLRFGEEPDNKIIIIGNEEESTRVNKIVSDIQPLKNILGFVGLEKTNSSSQNELGNIEQLNDIVEIYKPGEIIFCAKDISSSNIMEWMIKLGADIDYKIIAEQSLSIIGSNSKNTAGDLYATDIQLKIALPESKRAKRLLDITCAVVLFATLPVHIIFVRNRAGFIKNIFSVFYGSRTWVGYCSSEKSTELILPSIKKGILSPADSLQNKYLDTATLNRLNMLYAKDYKPVTDIEIILKGYKKLGTYKE